MRLMKRIELDSYETWRAVVDYVKRWYPEVINRNGEPERGNTSIDTVFESFDFDKEVTIRMDFPNGSEDLLSGSDLQDILNDEPER